jgi:hypothetical protein
MRARSGFAVTADITTDARLVRCWLSGRAAGRWPRQLSGAKRNIAARTTLVGLLGDALMPSVNTAALTELSAALWRQIADVVKQARLYARLVRNIGAAKA